VTPDAVIHRYLQLIAQPRVELGELCALIGSDADLLSRWLRLFNCRADLRELQSELASLMPREFDALAQAQAWFVLPVVGSARLSLDQWQAVLKAACLAEVLYAERADEIAPNIRTRTLLALSGAGLTADPALQELIDFRGINPVLLEDSSLEIKVFAIVDGLETGREVELAKQLLSLDEDDFSRLMAEADRRVRDLVVDIGVEVDDDTDWAERIWMRQQINIACSCFADASTDAAFVAAHETVSGMLFSQVPELFLHARGELTSRVHIGLTIRPTSITSRIAQSTRVGQILPLRDAKDLAVVDRQVLRSLDAEDGFAVPVQTNTTPPSVLVFKADDDVDVEFAAELYAEELAKWLGRGADASDESLTSNEVDRFRAAEIQRLREIVHEANNPLSIVHNYLHILELRLQDDPELAEQLEMIGQELRRAGDVIASARQVPELVAENLVPQDEASEFNLVDSVRRTGELHRGYADESRVNIDVRVDVDEVSLESAEDKLTQVLSNLVKNAIEACEAGDTVTMRTRADVYRDGQRGVEVIVEDTGPGIDPEVLAILYEPKETSKGGEHQGLGLHLTYRLVSELSGHLDVRTSPGRGTSFHVFLPLRQGGNQTPP
jgi:signal transduction histidine kinase